MSLTEIATLAETVAALGVIATLAFVAFQIRQNTVAIKNANFQASQERMASLQSRSMSEQVARVIQKGKKSYAQLDETEKLIFASWFIEYQLVASNFMRLGREGILRPELIDMAQQRLRNLLRNPGVQEYLSEKDREVFPASAEKLISELIARS